MFTTLSSGNGGPNQPQADMPFSDGDMNTKPPAIIRPKTAHQPTKRSTPPPTPASDRTAPIGLTTEDQGYLESRAETVRAYQSSSLRVAEALLEIFEYKDGLLWRPNHRKFIRFLAATWAFDRKHLYRLFKTGKVYRLLREKSPNGDTWPKTAGQIRPLLGLPEELQMRVWCELVAEIGVSQITAANVRERAEKYQTPEPEATAPKPESEASPTILEEPASPTPPDDSTSTPSLPSEENERALGALRYFEETVPNQHRNEVKISKHIRAIRELLNS